MSSSAASRHLWASQRDHVDMAAREEGRDKAPGVTSDGEVHSEARARALMQPYGMPSRAEVKAERLVRRQARDEADAARLLDALGIGGAS